jgi:hypothetical protein
MSIFTYKERTAKNTTVGKAVGAAKDVLRVKHKLHTLCTNCIGNMALSDEITIEKASQITEELIGDTVYYARPSDYK